MVLLTTHTQVGDTGLMKIKTKPELDLCFRIFNEYTINFLARKLNYKTSYLVKVLDNPEGITDRFKHNATELLERTGEELFALVERAEEKASDTCED